MLGRRLTLRVLIGTLLCLTLLLGAHAATASAAAVTTECTLQAKNSPTTVGQDAEFRFFAAARFPEELPPSPSGVVTFFDGLPILGNVLGFAILPPDFAHDNNDLTFKTADLSVGDHTVYAVLAPSSTGPCPVVPSAVHHVNPPPASPSSTGISSSANPSKYSQNVTFTAAVARQGGGAVSGTVQFKADGNDLGGPQNVDGSGNASVSTATLAVGNHSITAEFTSSNANTLNSSGSLPGGQTVQPADTRTGVTSSRNPSEAGQAVTFTAQVSAVAPGAGTPTGTVQFSDNGTPIGSAQSLDGSGSASITTSGLAVGAHTITAAYTPANGNYTGSSGSLSQTVERARTTLTYDGATSGDFHDPAVLAATLKREYDGSPVAGRTVHFAMASQACDGTTNAAGRASCTITPQDPAGTYTVASSFVGDAGFQPSQDSDPFTVTREQTSLEYTGDAVIANGGSARASAVLREDDGAPAISGRSVTFTLGSGATAQSCTALTDATGRAACTISPVAQPLGAGTVKSVFAQDAYYLASSDTDATILYAFPSKGAFVVGDRSAVSGASVTFFGAQWDKDNSLSGGSAPSSFKGFATLPGQPPRCGGTFAADPGNSGGPPASVPSYMGTLVTSKVAKSGSDIGGTVTRIVVVKTTAYGPSPGAGGKGTVVAVVCQ
jgi:hypothetical protein